MSLKAFDNRAVLAQALADAVAADLRDAVRDRGEASLAVSGGSTPRDFLTELGTEPVPWEQVTVTLADERWVPTSSERSNQKLLAETLFAGEAAAARFVPLYGATPEPDDAMGALALSLNPLLPLDVLVLGMGDDGHTASLFPGADRLEQAFADDAPVALPIRAPGLPERRVTLSAPVLKGARSRYLLMAGPEKRAVFEAAPDDSPIRRILSPTDPVFWAP